MVNAVSFLRSVSHFQYEGCSGTVSKRIQAGVQSRGGFREGKVGNKADETELS